MADDQIYVDGELFTARLEEQNHFRLALRDLLPRDIPEISPPVFLVGGDTGMGKSTLLRRLRDIAARESPFEATCQTMLVDLEIERTGLTVFRERTIAGQEPDIFAILYRAARDAGWGHQFVEYQSAFRQLNRAEKKFLDVLNQESWGKKFSLIHTLQPEEILAVYRRHDTPVMDFIEGGGEGNPVADPLQSVEQAQVRDQIDHWFASRMRFEDQEEEIFRSPSQSFVKSLSTGFGKISSTKPLIILLDSFDIAGEGGKWLWAVIQSTGKRVLWVVASEKVGFGEFEVDGSQEFSQMVAEKLRVYKLPPVSEANVGNYLASRAPDRLVTGESVQQIYSLCQGIPLALQICGDLWASGVPVADILQGSPKGTRDLNEIIEFISHRFLEIGVDSYDRRPLTFLAIQPRMDVEVLGTILQPGKGSFELREQMTRLANRYFAVRRSGGIRYHPLVKEHLSRYLLRRRIRISEEVKSIASIAAKIHENNRFELESSFGRLEDRYGNNEWRSAILDTLYWTFLDNEFNAWRQMTPDFIDALGYDPPLAQSLSDVAEYMEPVLSKTGRQRLRIFQVGMDSMNMLNSGNLSTGDGRLDTDVTMLAELERWLTRYGSKDLNASERRAILDLRRGEIYSRYGQFDDALSMFLKVEKSLPPRGKLLPQQLAADFERLGERLAWRRGGYQIYGAFPSPGAETSLKKAISMGIRNARIYHSLGAVQLSLGKPETALENLLQTVTMSPDNELAWNDLGDIYHKQNLTDKAIPAYRRAVEIDINFIQPRLSLAKCYRELKQEKEFQAEMEACKALIDDQDYYLRACFEAVSENTETALEFLRLARENNQFSVEQFQRDPNFDYLRANPEIDKLVRS